MKDIMHIQGVYDTFSKSYDRNYIRKREDSTISGIMKVYEKLFWNRLIEKLDTLPENIKVLDAGGGTGLWSIPLAKMGYNVTLLDLSEGMINAAKEKYENVETDGTMSFVQSSVTDMPFDDQTFDFIICEGDVISKCYESHEQGLSELIRVAKKGGYIYLGVDNIIPFIFVLISKGLKCEADDLIKNRVFYNDIEGPSYLFSPGEIKIFFESKGHIVEKEYGTPTFMSLLTRDLTCRLSDEDVEYFYEIERKLEALDYRDTGWHYHYLVRRQ